MNASRIIAPLILVLLLAGPGPIRASEPCGDQQITPTELDLALHEGGGGDYLLLDMRPSALFLAGTIPGAINAGKLAEMSADSSHEDADDKALVIITSDGLPDETLRKWIAQLCEKPVKLWILQGGLQAWRAQGLALEDPTERMTEPGSVPFVIPRGLCELNAPAQEYD